MSPIGELEFVGHDTDDGIGLAVKGHTPADDAWIGGEVIAPEFVAEEHDVTLARAVLIGRKRAAEKRTDTKEREKVGCYRTGLNGLRALLAAKCKSVEAVGGHLFKRGTLALPVEVIGGRNREHGQAGKALRGRHVPNQHDAGGVFIEQRTKKDGVYDGEDGGVSTDAQGQDQNGGDGEAWIATQDSQREPQIREQVSHGRAPPVTASGLSRVAYITDELGWTDVFMYLGNPGRRVAEAYLRGLRSAGPADDVL